MCTAIDMKADAIMDLSTYGDTGTFRRKTVEMCPVMIGTVPAYDAVARHGKNVSKIGVDDFFKVVADHAEDGVDFMTIHAGLNWVAVERIRKNPRLMHVVSRGVSVLLEWMEENERENPFYEHFDRLLEICKTYDITLSLGDGLRPGSLKDATDAPQIQELIFLWELTKQAWDQDVQVMIEGPGHVPLNEIAANMQLEKKLCHGAPFYVLGPLMTDVAPGYDHITSAIGGAIAGAAGADFLCYVTPAEHLRLPDVNDMKEGIVASRIAAHAADIAKGVPGAMEWDNQMSEARKNLDWEKMLSLAMDPVKARAYRESSAPIDQEGLHHVRGPLRRETQPQGLGSDIEEESHGLVESGREASMIGSSERRSSMIISELPNMTLSMLLKSWAIPPASLPMDSIFMDWKSWLSSFFVLRCRN